MKAIVAACVLAVAVVWATVGGILPATDRWASAQERIAQVEATAAIRIAEANAERDKALAERDAMIAAFHAAESGTRELGSTLRLLILAGFLFLAGVMLLAVAVGWQGAQQGYGVTVRVNRARGW